MTRFEIDSVYYDGLIGFELVPPAEANAWTVYRRRFAEVPEAVVDFFFEYGNDVERERARVLALGTADRLLAEMLKKGTQL